MERNRVLWVIFSISLFLVVVLAGGLYLLRPVSKRRARDRRSVQRRPKPQFPFRKKPSNLRPEWFPGPTQPSRPRPLP